VAGVQALISRSGNARELGYEIVILAEDVYDLWGALAAAGVRCGLALAGAVAAFNLHSEQA
jgi:glycine cleavage system aminomethyltransferase T